MQFFGAEGGRGWEGVYGGIFLAEKKSISSKWCHFSGPVRRFHSQCIQEKYAIFFPRQNFTVSQQIFNLPCACWWNVNFGPWLISRVPVKIQGEGGEKAQVLHVEFARKTLAALQCSHGNADTEFIKNKLWEDVVGPGQCLGSEHSSERLKALFSVCHVKKKNNNKLMWKTSLWKYLLLFQTRRS